MSNSKDKRRERRALERAIALNESASRDAIQPNSDGVPPEIATSDKATEAKKNVLFSSNANPSPRDKNKTCHCKPDSTPMWKMIAEIGAILIGAYVAGIYYRQLSQMVESNRISRESLESVQRAFIVGAIADKIYRGNLQTQSGPEDSAMYFIDWQNTGSTPAPVAIGFATYGEFPTDHQDSWEFITPRDSKMVSSVIGPHAIVQSEPIDIPTSQIEQISEGKEVVIWGWKVYRDIFPKSKDHITEVCWRHTRNITIHATGRMVDQTWQTCDKHNCSDENCKDFKELTSYLPQ